LRDLFKDEVRTLGHALGLPDEMIWRHPFPGPGPGRALSGEVRPERLEVLRKADAIVLERIAQGGSLSQSAAGFCRAVAVQSVGVMGDFRRMTTWWPCGP